MADNDNPIHDFTKTQILVVGDIMIDQYWIGEVKRISPEAPVPVVDLSRIENRLGGAANVARNLKVMGANVQVLGLVGDDEYGKEVKNLLDKEKIGSNCLLISKERRTTLKSRIMAHGQNLLRIDQEDIRDLNQEEWQKFKMIFDEYCASCTPDIIILQDYNKGLLTPQSIEYIIAYANKHHIPTIVDPKKENFFSYKKCTVFKPNKKEVMEALGQHSLDNLNTINQTILSRLENKFNFITLGSDGIFVGSKDQSNVYATKKRLIIDVCGAGDTVLAILALYWTKNVSPSALAKLANIGGGQVCGIEGVAPIDPVSFLEEVTHQNFL